jgi:glutamyl-tRNA reductase
MKLQLIGCNHRGGSPVLRERLTIPASRLASTLSNFGDRFPRAEAVVLSTCNRIEIYTATSELATPPSQHDVAAFLAEVQGLDPDEVFDKVFQRTGQDAIQHLFAVAASLDSMVIGETQIMSQVKQAYELATQHNTTGQFTHAAFQRAMYVAKRVSNETGLHRNRVSIPSVAIRDFARQIFESFAGKSILMVGAGEMAKEALRCLVEDGADTITVINRSRPRAEQLASQFGATAGEWQRLSEYLAEADLVICATGADEAVISQELFDQVAPNRHQRPLFILDLAIPRNVEPSIADALGVYLYAVDDLAEACEANQRLRAKELPKAMKIVEDESTRFMSDIESRATGPIIRRLKEQAHDIRDAEFARLIAKLDDLNADYHSEIENSFRRLVNKLLHPPLESLREDAGQPAPPANLVDALRRLFKLRE